MDNKSNQVLSDSLQTLANGNMTVPQSISQSIPAPETSCPMCNGAGAVVYDVPMSDPNWGKAWPCPVCSADEGSRRGQWLRKISGLSDAELSLSLKDTIVINGNKQAIERIQQWRMNPQRPSGWITLYGPPGVGKSHLLMVAVNELRKLGVKAIYVTATTLFNELKRTFDEGGTAALLDLYQSAVLLAIDELDHWHQTPWSENTLVELLNARYRNINSQATMLAMNESAALPDMIYSRARDTRSLFLHMTGKDLRRL